MVTGCHITVKGVLGHAALQPSVPLNSIQLWMALAVLLTDHAKQLDAVSEQTE
jgi:hypothetical protein